MTLTELEPVVAKYLKTSQAEYADTGYNLFVTAANNARKRAELSASWNELLVNVRLVVNALNGVALSTAVLTGTENAETPTLIAINSIKYGYLVDDNGNELPIDVTTKDQIFSNLRTEQRLNPIYGYGRNGAMLWGNVNEVSGLEEPPKLARNGNQLYIYPLGESTTSQVVHLDVFRWADDYPLSDYEDIEDWFLLRGSEYMLWSTICEMNHLLKEFVPRQEGNLPNPTALRDAALLALQTNEAYATMTTPENY